MPSISIPSVPTAAMETGRAQMSNYTANTLTIYSNGDWCVFRPYATGVDTGPAHYGQKPRGCDADTQAEYYGRAGFVIDDRRAAQ